MNAVEKILAMHAGRDHVKPGQIIDVKLDFIMANDATAALSIDTFKNELKGSKVFDKDKIVMVMDHYTPSSSTEAADLHNKMREFVREQGLAHCYDCAGVCHQLMLENHIKPSQIVIGADSHTCTYGAIGALGTGMGSTDIAMGWLEGRIWMRVPEAIKFSVSGNWPEYVYPKDLILKIIGDITARGATYKAMVFEGGAISALDVSGRATLCNMGIEAGAKFAFIEADDTTDAYMKAAGRTDYTPVHSDEDAQYEKVYSYDAGELTPQVACPGGVDNVADISKPKGIRINELFLGACTNGRLDDLRIAAGILAGRRVSKDVRFLVTPASNKIYLEALRKGYITTLIEAGAIVTNPGCSACFGGSVGILGRNERLLSSANRNFTGRVGSAGSEIYLGSPATVAASALTGRITDPREV